MITRSWRDRAVRLDILASNRSHWVHSLNLPCRVPWTWQLRVSTVGLQRRLATAGPLIFVLGRSGFCQRGCRVRHVLHRAFSSIRGEITWFSTRAGFFCSCSLGYRPSRVVFIHNGRLQAIAHGGSPHGPRPTALLPCWRRQLSCQKL